MSADNEKIVDETVRVEVEASKQDIEAAEKPLTEKTTEELLSLVKEKEEEAHTNYDRMLRMAAELENYKKRAEKEKAEQINYANEAFMKDLLAVLDNLERAIQHAKNDPTDKQALLNGVEMVLKECVNVMGKYGLKAVDTSGKMFDPQYHEAVTVEENDSVEENTILDELQKGYIFQDRLLRPAMVIVSRRPANNSGNNVSQ